jgi:hypothetical protein
MRGSPRSFAAQKALAQDDNVARQQRPFPGMVLPLAFLQVSASGFLQ